VLPLRLCARFIHFLSRLFLKLYFKDLSAYRTFDFNISVIGIKYSVIAMRTADNVLFLLTCLHPRLLSFMSLAIFIITGSKISPPCNEPLVSNFPLFRQKLREKVVEILISSSVASAVLTSIKILVPSRLAIWSLTYFSRAYLAMLDVVTLASC